MVLELDDVLLDDQFFALVPAYLGQKSLDSQLGAAGKLLRRLGKSQVLLLQRDDVIQVLKPLIQRISP